MFRAAFVFALLLTPSGHAAQPYSESLMDCAALVSVTRDRLSHRMSDARQAWMTRYRDRLEQAALQQAKAEGHGDPQAHVAALRQAKSAQWETRSMMWLAFGEGRDWFAYCRSFSDHLGIEMPSAPE